MDAGSTGLRHHGHVSDDQTSGPRTASSPAEALPPDPSKYDEYRNVAARKRGLDQPYIVGGEDPELPAEVARERPYVRLLVAMIAIIVALGFVLGIISAL